jgi:hypothetical protein
MAPGRRFESTAGERSRQYRGGAPRAQGGEPAQTLPELVDAARYEFRDRDAALEVGAANVVLYGYKIGMQVLEIHDVSP